VETLLVSLILATCLNDRSIYNYRNTPMVCIDYYNNCVTAASKFYYGGSTEAELKKYFQICKQKREKL